METGLLVVHVLVSIALIGIILIQHGKGADAGASFGGGASQTVFGAAGAANFLTRTTKWFAVVFFSTSLALAWLARENAEAQNAALFPEAVVQPATDVPVGVVPSVPAASDVPAAPAPAGE